MRRIALMLIPLLSLSIACSVASAPHELAPVEGRRAVQGARMVPATWPGEPIGVARSAQ